MRTLLGDSIREYTQTNLEPGNCWQTCIACLLHVEPSELPDQTKFDVPVRDDHGKVVRYDGPSYVTALQAYLREHHGLGYVQMYEPSELLASLAVRSPGFHMMAGRTVRTATNGSRHVVVARYGELAWDPHPSRAGLLDDINWAFLIPFPDSWRTGRLNAQPCVCRACVRL